MERIFRERVVPAIEAESRIKANRRNHCLMFKTEVLNSLSSVHITPSQPRSRCLCDTEMANYSVRIPHTVLWVVFHSLTAVATELQRPSLPKVPRPPSLLIIKFSIFYALINWSGKCFNIFVIREIIALWFWSLSLAAYFVHRPTTTYTRDTYCYGSGGGGEGWYFLMMSTGRVALLGWCYKY